MQSVDEKANRFNQLHRSGDCFIMPNAWDAGSAVLLQQAGFQSIATTSAGIAYSHALTDGAGALSFESALDATTEIVAAVDLPVSIDSENLYADDPEAVFVNMQTVAATGVVGASIEDYTGNLNDPFYELELAVERVRAVKAAVAELGHPIVITARTECYLYGHADPFNESVKRVNRYFEAGADCLYVPGLRDIETIRRMVNAVDGPLNVVMGLSGSPISLAELRDAGVTRVSIGGSLARAALGLVRAAAEEMLQQGTFDFSKQQIADSELCQLFAENSTKNG